MADEGDIPCQRHPRVRTRLSCARCGTPICPRCLVHTPVGVRCPECANLRRLPTFELGLSTYLKALAAGMALAGATGTVWGFLFFRLYSLPFLPWIATIGIGYVIGEGVSVSVNRKRGRQLQYIAGGCMVVSYLVAGYVSPLFSIFAFSDLFMLLILVIAVWVAAGRVG